MNSEYYETSLNLPLSFHIAIRHFLLRFNSHRRAAKCAENIYFIFAFERPRIREMTGPLSISSRSTSGKHKGLYTLNTSTYIDVTK
jgi:hypothetical protein